MKILCQGITVEEPQPLKVLHSRLLYSQLLVECRTVVLVVLFVIKIYFYFLVAPPSRPVTSLGISTSYISPPPPIYDIYFFDISRRFPILYLNPHNLPQRFEAVIVAADGIADTL